MKKLNKLQISSEKIIKTKELMILRGGYGSCLCCCITVMGEPLGYVFSETSTCVLDCELIFGPGVTGYCTS